MPETATADDRVWANSDFYLKLEDMKAPAAVARDVLRPDERIRPEDWVRCVIEYLITLRSAQNNTRANLVPPKPDMQAYSMQTADPVATLGRLRQRHAADAVMVRQIDETLARLGTKPVVGARLEFRIASAPANLGRAELAGYVEWLKAGRVGPWWESELRWIGPLPSHMWLPVSGELTNAPQLVTGEHDGGTYMLVSNMPGQTMVPGDGENGWGLARVHATKDGMDGPAVGVELDEGGAERFAALTRANINSALAIVVDGKVVSAPIIRAALGKAALIVGKFTEQEVKDLVQALRAGMPPARARS